MMNDNLFNSPIDDEYFSFKKYSFQEVGKVLNIKRMGRNNIIALLKWKDVLDDNNLPTDFYGDKDFFIIEDVFRNDLTLKITRVTPIGISFIKKIIDQHKADFFKYKKELEIRKNERIRNLIR